MSIGRGPAPDGTGGADAPVVDDRRRLDLHRGARIRAARRGPGRPFPDGVAGRFRRSRPPSARSRSPCPTAPEARFVWSADTKISGVLTPGARVTIRYEVGRGRPQRRPADQRLAQLSGRARRATLLESRRAARHAARRDESMGMYIIAEPCIGTKDTACVDVCPVDCIHPRKDEGTSRRPRCSTSIPTSASSAATASPPAR